MDKWLKKEVVWVVIILLDCFLVYLNSNTYDSGDSIVHFLYSKQSFQYPKYLMHHWAKPIFVLLSAPFTQLGWIGMKMFNTICVLGSTYYCYQLFKSYQLKPFAAVLLCFAAPQFFLVQASGLTEPLFALVLIAIVYYLKTDRLILGLVLLSFLPFIRSEGWLIAPVVLVYLVSIKKFRYSPYILMGTVLYGLVGLWYYSDFLWMFHQNPYSGIEEKYGSGEWLHYVNQLPYVIGFPLFMFFLLGMYDGFHRLIKAQMTRHEFILIYGMVFAYITAHSIFWAEGLFHSFGLNRVLIVLIPLIAFIGYRGIERIICAFSFVPSKFIWLGACALLLVFPFTKNKAALDLPDSITKEPLQLMIDDIRSYTDSIYGSRPLYYGNFYIPMSYNKDIDNSKEAMSIGLLKEFKAKKGSLVLWDSYFAPSDQGISTEYLEQKEELLFVRRFNCEDCDKRYFIDLYIAD